MAPTFSGSFWLKKFTGICSLLPFFASLEFLIPPPFFFAAYFIQILITHHPHGFSSILTALVVMVSFPKTFL